MTPYRFRSIFISDFHLGTRNLHSEQLLEFLTYTESEYLYLVGDIFDLLQAQKKWYWPEINDRIVDAIFTKAGNGTKVFYIPGNHDHILRKFHGNTINSIKITNQVIHETADGRKYLVIHGDKFDPVVQKSPWLANIGSSAYEKLLVVNRWFNRIRKALGKDHKSLSAWLKHQVKIAVNYMGRFEEVVVREAGSCEVDGLICGHIHRAAVRKIGDVLYTNSGDWVESCTALAENQQGYLGVIEWQKEKLLSGRLPTAEYENLYRDRCLASSN